MDNLEVSARADTPTSVDDRYVPGPDSQPQPGVPKGKVFEFTFDHSKIYTGTTRTIQVYVPAQYRADNTACVYVALDEFGFELPIVFDNLIHKREIPVTIAIAVPPGVVASASPLANPRFNRSFEFDSLNDSLARFLLEEIIPAVQRHKTPDGLPILLSDNPNDRAAGGASTGGIGAFTLGWQRPDAFRRIFTAIGTFLGMRGGDRYPVLVRKTEPKPLRVFMQGGSNDGMPGILDEMGDWWMGNQTMQRALEFSGYQVKHVWGEGSHTTKHATAIFPDALRWLWKDWPQPVLAGESRNTFRKAILRLGELWRTVSGGYRSAGALAVDREGLIVFRDVAGEKTWTIDSNGTLNEYRSIKIRGEAITFGPDGRLYSSDVANARIVAYTASGKASTIAMGLRARNLVVTHRGILYLTEPQSGDTSTGHLWMIEPGGQKCLIDSGLNHPSGIALTPDGRWLAVAESKTHWGYSYRIQPDGTVENKQRFYWFHVPDEADNSGAGGWAMDSDGRLYAATRMGIQVFDRNGRVRAILPVPGGEVVDLTFGGIDFDTLYVSCADYKVYRRKLAVKGLPPWASPIPLPEWGPG